MPRPAPTFQKEFPPSAARPFAHWCPASFHNHAIIQQRLIFILQPTRFFPLTPCSAAAVTRLRPASRLRLRSAAGASPPLLLALHKSSTVRPEQLPALKPGAYVIEDIDGGCSPVTFHVSGVRSAISVFSVDPHWPSASAKRRDCSPVPPQPNEDASPSVCCGLGQSPFLLYTHDKDDLISSVLHRGSGAAHASAINVRLDI